MKQRSKLAKQAAKLAAALFIAASAVSPSVHASGVLADSSSVSSVIASTTSSVVAIIGKPGGERKAWEANRYELAHGTGVIVRSNGYILTNAHVVKDMRNITVVTSDGKSYSGKTTHYDEESDLALVKIDAYGLIEATFASQSDIKVGESVIAIGTPLSFSLRNSVTYGIVSGMERSIQSKYQLIQTDAAINPGNSGGALVNMKGEVIGINTLKYVSTGVDSLGFAIPVDTVKHVLDHFFKYGKVKRTYLGLELGESWEAVVGMPTTNGLTVVYVEPDSPAAKAGIKQGDELVGINSAKTSNLTEYNEALKAYLPDDKVKLKLQSNGMLKEFDVVFDEDTSSGGEVVQAADGSYIDSDQGKTGIGDSHFGWSMKYPAGLIKADQSEDGSSVTFADSKGEFAVSIIIQEKQSADLSPYALLRRLGATQYGTTVLEKRYVDGGSHPYAKLVGKRESGEYYEIRSFLKEDRMYFVILAVEKEENYSSSFKRNGYNNLLDSFVLGYDAKDESLKDISVFQTKNTITTEYGVAFDIPEEWSEDQYGDGFSYASKDGEKSLSLKISSAASGDTLKAWSEREERDFAARFGADYREIAGAKETEVGGTHALTNRFSSTMGDKWKSTDVWYVIKDKMKVEFRLNYPTMSDAEEIKKLAAGLTESVQFRKEEMNGSIGFIQDEDELFNPDETATYTSKKYKYTIQAPEYWSTGLDRDVDTGTKSYSFEGGSLSINADDRTGPEEAINNIDKEHKKNAENDANYVVTATDEDMFGTSVKKFELHYRTRNIPYVQQEYVFSIGGITYTIKARINEAVKTEAMWNRLDNTIRTFASSEQ